MRSTGGTTFTGGETLHNSSFFNTDFICTRLITLWEFYEKKKVMRIVEEECSVSGNEIFGLHTYGLVAKISTPLSIQDIGE